MVAGHRARARTVEVAGITLTMMEAEDVDAVLDSRIHDDGVAPYGVVLWPSAVAIAEVLAACGSTLGTLRVVDVGAGTGLCSLLAAAHGAEVLALDHDDLTLALVEESARRSGLAVATSRFDLAAAEPLPEADLFIFADLLYEQGLARLAATRVCEVVSRGRRALVGDPGREFRTTFVDEAARLGCIIAFAERAVADDSSGTQHRIGIADLGGTR